MSVAAEELELCRRDLELYGYSMLSEGKRVPPERWDEVFQTRYPGVVINETAQIDEETWSALAPSPPDSSQL